MPVSMLASGEDEPVTPQEGDYAANTQEERHVSAETEEKVGETKPKESQAEGAEKSDDQVEDESTKKTDVEVAGLENDYPTEEAEHGDETYSTLPVVGILTQLQTTLETERAINDSASSEVSMIKEPADQEEKKGDDVVESNEKDFVSDILEAKRLHGDKSGEAEKIKEESGLAGKSLPIEEINLQEEHKEEVKVQEETREIAQVLPREEILISSSPLSAEEQEHVISDEKQEEREPQQDFNGSTSEKISLQVEHLKDFETSKKEQKDETHETVKEEDQIVDIKDKKKDDEEQEIVSSEVKKDNKDARELEVGNDFVSRDGEKEEVPHNALENEEEMNEVVASEKQISDPVGVIKKASEAEHEDPVDDIKSNDDRDFPTEQAPKDQSDEVSADETVPKEAIGEELKVPSSKVLDDIQENSNTEAVTNFADRDLPVQNLSELIQSHQSPNQVEETSFEFNKAQEDKKEETVDALITNVQVQDQPKEDFEAAAIEKEISEQEHKLNDLTDVQEDIGTYVKVQVPDDEIKGDGHDSVAAQKEETSSIEEKREVEHVKAEMEDAIKHEVSVEEKNNTSENIDHEAAKEIEQEEGKQTNIVKEEIREEEKEINQESFNNVKETDDAIDKTQPEIRDIESLSSVSKTQDKPEPEYEVPNQQKREITNEVPSLENSKIEEELQKKDEESENTKDLFSVVKETEPTLKEPARKSLSDHIQKEPKTEEDENDDEDHEHKDDKTSPDSIVMVEAKDTVSIVKTHKKSHGILSGVGSKVKHSISKVKKVLTGKSSHTTKPSSPT